VEYRWEIEKMPDCAMKYDKIQKTKNAENKYTDSDFPPNDSSLGNNKARFGVAKWKRASEDPLCRLYFDSASCEDI
jgi:hypothetical protein